VEFSHQLHAHHSAFSVQRNLTKGCIADSSPLDLQMDLSNPDQYLIHDSLDLPTWSAPLYHLSQFTHLCTLSHMSNRQTDTQTTLRVTSVAICYISCITCRQCRLKIVTYVVRTKDIYVNLKSLTSSFSQAFSHTPTYH